MGGNRDPLTTKGRHDRQLMVLLVTPPSWRPDLTDPADLAEEVITLRGLRQRPGPPAARPTAGQGPWVAAAEGAAGDRPRAWRPCSFVEVHSDPFRPGGRGPTASCSRRRTRRRPAVKVANPPPAADQPQLRLALLPGLFRTLVPNAAEAWHSGLALFETGQVFLPRPGSPGIAPILATDRGPAEAELAALAAALPELRKPPRSGRSVLAGNGKGLLAGGALAAAAGWADAIEAARSVGAVRPPGPRGRGQQAKRPGTPGRCAALACGAHSGGKVAGGPRGRAAPAGAR